MRGLGKSVPAANQHARDGGERSGQYPQLDASEESWLRHWAFAISPQGLALSAERFWELTPTEIQALGEVREQQITNDLRRWAVERADYRNVNFRGGDRKDRPWMPDEFLSAPAREDSEQTPTDSIKAEQFRFTRLTAEMRMSNFDDSKLPAWARLTPEEKAKKERLAQYGR